MPTFTAVVNPLHQTKAMRREFFCFRKFDFDQGLLFLIEPTYSPNRNVDKKWSHCRVSILAVRVITSGLAWLEFITDFPTILSETTMRSRQLRQLSICQFSTNSWSLAEDLARYQTYGFQSVGIWERKLREMDLEKAVDAVFESRLNVSSMHWAGGFTGEDGRLEETVEQSVQTIRLAARIGSPCVFDPFWFAKRAYFQSHQQVGDFDTFGDAFGCQ